MRCIGGADANDRAADRVIVGAANARVVLTLLQIGFVVAVYLVLASASLPFAFDPIAVIVTAAVVQAILQSAARRANGLS